MGVAWNADTLKVLFENLEAGMSIEEVIEQFPVTREQLDSLMAYVARSHDMMPRPGDTPRFSHERIMM